MSRSLRALPRDGRKIRIYQDGMPVCGQEVELARQLAQKGSANHRLVVDLVERGALLMGTEDPELLCQERGRLKSGANLSQDAAASHYDHLMERRDRYIANRINSTLRQGELGLVFIGALHRLADKLPEDIEVVQLGEPRLSRA
ncbi:TraB/GumN family protein [Acidobacteria bacterium AH-259-G07]|nr:TraB/GumN family protein [Acidobacteria bacterium AH-259-G07]